MSVATGLITADELLLMPDCQKHCELVKGELRKMSPTGGEHGIAVAKLTIAIGRYVEENDLGEIFGAETGFKLSSAPDTVRVPEIAFIQKERIPAGSFPQSFGMLCRTSPLKSFRRAIQFMKSKRKSKTILQQVCASFWL
jgi:Uma2 family endonuclease